MAGESVSLLQQISSMFNLQTAATADGNGTTATTDGYNGAQMVEIQKTGVGTTTVTLQGSYDQVVWYAAGYQQVDGQATLSRSISPIAIAAGSVDHVYQVLDLYPYLRAVMSGTNGAVILTAHVYCVGV